MTDQSAELALEMTARWVTFAIDLALFGDLNHALDQADAGPSREQPEQTAIENLFWD